MMRFTRPAPQRRQGAVLRLAALSGLAALASAAHADEAATIPPIPMIVIPDVLGVEPVQRQFEAALASALPQIDGLRVAPAHCDASGAFTSGGDMLVRDETGIAADLGDQGTYVVDPDGAGAARVGDISVVVEQDGSGAIRRDASDGAPAVQITVEADGSGSYSGPMGTITLDGRGGGTWSSEHVGQIVIEADGSGSWSGPQGQITNEGDGSGTWSGPPMVINDGDGRGLVGGDEVAMEPLAPVPPAGRFPPLTRLRIPPAACGYVVTLDDRILFDFDKSDLRADADATVEALSAAFVKVGPKRLDIRGHTDAKGSDAYNQALSERRAQTIEQALAQRGVSSAMTAQGLGEGQPAAPNEIDGKDNPAGRQLNRRVEIFVPHG